ncbi:MAG TPA: peptide chain release factor 2 [Acidimicrobiia bacterium]|nr:peptide chain release factor 2 [Acidimicrobiia bacterium]
MPDSHDIAALRDRLLEARGFFDLDQKTAELEELRERVAEPEFWNDPEQARSVSQKLNRYESIFGLVSELEQSLEDAELLIEFADEDSIAEASQGLARVASELGRLELESLYFGEHDEHPAILTVYAGAGGVDAQDWAEMLFRMYERYLTDKGYSVTRNDYTEGEEAGIKSATMTVRGDRAYGNLEGERGTHRLVRISPFDSQARRHTAFAGVDVVPDFGDEDIQIEIGPDDLRIDTFRSQGAGGQHVNTTDSAVRITHLPTGLVASCQNERSQLQNRERAMQMLKAKLLVLAQQEQAAQLDEIRGENVEAGWGRQIRSYVLQPYQMVKDLRSEVELGNVDAILDGDLDAFVEGYLRWRRAQHEKRTSTAG